MPPARIYQVVPTGLERDRVNTVFLIPVAISPMQNWYWEGKHCAIFALSSSTIQDNMDFIDVSCYDQPRSTDKRQGAEIIAEVQ